MIPTADILTALRSLPTRMDSPEARVMLVAIGLQESRFEHRRQLVGKPPRPTGPAKSFWQFEEKGGCGGVLTHRHTKPHMRIACFRYGVAPNPRALWDAMENNDILAAVAARLNLWWDPQALPAVGDVYGAWELYLRTWRPGKPHRKTWDACYAQAVELVASWPAR